MPQSELDTLRHKAQSLEAELARLRQQLPPRQSALAGEFMEDQHYRGLLGAIDLGFCIVEMRFDEADRAVDYRIVEGNAAFERMTGLHQSAGRWVSEMAPGLERHWFDTYGRVALTGEPVRFENAAVSFGRWYDVQALRIGKAEQRRVAILFNDISERRLAELALAKSEAHWRGLFEKFDEGLILGELSRDSDGKVIDWRYLEVNRAWGEMVGISHLHAPGRSIRELFPGIEQAWIDDMAQVVEQNRTITFVRPVGSLGRWYEGRVHPLGEERFAALFHEVTDSRNAETRRNALLELQDRLRQRPEPAELCYAAAEIIGRTLGVQRAGYCMLDEDRETAWLERDWSSTPPSLAGAHRMRDFGRYIDDLIRGEPVHIEDVQQDPRTRQQAATHERFGIRALLNFPVIEEGRTVALVFANSEHPRSWSEDDLAFVRDVADRTRVALERQRAEDSLRRLNLELESLVSARTAELLKAEELLHQSQKMEAVGQLTGGIAHDFNNLLAGISGSLDLLELRLRQNRLDNLDRYINAAQHASRRAAALTHRLLAFSRRQTLAPKPTDISRLVHSMEELVRRTVGPEVALEVCTSGQLWPTLVDPNQLENALLNLCINARDAMPSGGQVKVETANHWIDDRSARELDMTPGRYVSLSVSDTGTGMTPEVVSKAIDPFFTTKPLGMGTGLGLSMIYGFARQSGGQVSIRSQPGQGTQVCVYLPWHEQALVDGESSPSPSPVPAVRGNGTVLVVDDEPSVRMLVTELIEDLGYTALEAEDGPSGLKLLQSPVHLDLLVTDVGLPGGMNGRQMADAARIARPDLKVLFITGYAESIVSRNGALEAGMHVMTKPFAMEQLAARISELIDAAPADH